MNYNEKLRSIRIREAIVFLVVGMIVTGIITRVTSLDSIPGFGENLLIFIVFLGFIYMLRGTTDFADSIGSAFEHKNEIIYLLVINFLFGFFIAAFITFFDPSGFDTSALSKEKLTFQEIITIRSFIERCDRHCGDTSTTDRCRSDGTFANLEKRMNEIKKENQLS